MGDQSAAGITLVGEDELDQIRVEALCLEAGAEGFHDELRAVYDLRCGLDDDGRTRGESRRDAAGGDGHWEVPRRRHHGHAVGRELGGVVLQQARGLRVVGAEVDGLGDFRVSLRDGLVGLVGGDGDELAAAVGQLIGHGLERAGAVLGRTGAPLGAELGGAGHVLVDDPSVRHLVHPVLARVGSQGLKRPLAVSLQGWVGVRLVGEAPGARCLAAGCLLGLLQAVLGAARAGEGIPALRDGLAEDLLLVLQRLLLRGEEGVEEVLRSGVLLQAAHQVGDGDVEVLHVHHRGVEDLAALEGLADRGLLGRGHALEHLGIHHAHHAALGAQLVGKRRGVEVVGGHADAHAIGELGAQDVVEQAVVVGVHLILGGIGRCRPAVDLALDVLHGKVCALDDANLDVGAALGHALLSELGEVRQSVEGIRQVGLQHDAGLEVDELRLAEQLGEQAHGEVEVVVFLHIQVDEDLVRAARGGLVQRAQALLEADQGTLDIPGVELGHHGGSLDGHVGHARVLDELQGAVSAGAGFLITEHGLSEQVEVELLAGFCGLVQGLVEGFALGIEDQVSHHLAHAHARQRHDQVRQDRSEETTQAHQRSVDEAEEGSIVGGGDGLQRVGRDLIVFWAHDAVDEVHGEGHSVRVAQ